ncbi:glycoside hydrolase family 32 protein [Bacillus taeanensis]|uniref:Sucrose-6-phosphate hydrolase n=1 Tax=Bacillus taeanensis TaxID=273032 RepID=A0A366XZA5_9BACI|nr:glycoside hydrolase family 32 protein [Bacillus taeanensis]RBW70936.1 glycoside hydrolase family 32 protein [Bacillus taeanensis]
MNVHKQKIEEAEQSIAAVENEVSQNYWRLHYHLTPPAYWMNDPNGFSFYKGEYHLFYQHHPFSAEWGPMYWGHFKSSDLAAWERLPIALAPSEDYDKDGCFSGSAIEKDGKLYLMYTGNVWTGNNYDEQLKQVQALAQSEDGVTFEKLADNPVIAEAPAGNIHPFHFRDPKVWKYQDFYYTVLGSKTKQNTGQVLLYRSADLLKWEFVNVMAKGEGNFGFMWECPDLFLLDGQDVLVMSPQGVKPEGHLYHNLHQAGYVLGKLNYETGTYTHGPFHLLDYGFDFYAPQTTIDDKGRRILIAWMDMWESEMPTQNHNWAGAMTIPRIVTLKDNQLISKPAPEIEKLRKNEVSYQHVTIEGETSLEGISGDCLELELTIHAKNASQFGLKVRVSEEDKQETVLTYHKKEQLFIFDRSQSGEGPGGERKADVKLNDNELTLHIFIDKSSLEVFINEGEKVMTGRIYPSQKAVGITFFSDESIDIINFKKWHLEKSIK